MSLRANLRGMGLAPSALEALRASLAEVVLPFEAATMPPRAVYTDPEVHALEMAALWHGFAAGSDADLPRAGAWTRVPRVDASLVLLRGVDGEVRALHDVCRHRGVQLLDGNEGQLRGAELLCPYHGWCYGLYGQLLRAPGLIDEEEQRGSLGLRAAQVWSRWGQLFVAPGTSPGPRERMVGPPWLDELAPLRRARRVRWEVAANWKLLVENFQESQHFAGIHPGLELRTPARESTSVPGEGWLGGTMAIAEGIETVSVSGRRNGRPWISRPGRRRTVYDAWVAPNLLTSLQPDYLLTYRLTPRAVDRTEIVAEIYVHAEAPADAAALEDIAAFWDRTNAEDRAVCERQQRGLADRGHVPPRYARGEDGVHMFDVYWASRMLAALRGDA